MAVKKQKLTPWFPSEVKPVRIGVYQRAYNGGPAYCLWDGHLWRIGTLIQYEGAVDAASGARPSAWNQDLHWRGLAEQPK